MNILGGDVSVLMRKECKFVHRQTMLCIFSKIWLAFIIACATWFVCA